MDAYPDHDCAGEDEPGLERTDHGMWVVLREGDIIYDEFPVEYWKCRVCPAWWWLIDNTFYLPSEWDNVSDIRNRSRS